MPADLPPTDKAKLAAAKKSVEFVHDGMKLGLGTGSTAAWMVRCLAAKVKAEGLSVTCVPTSDRTGDLARELGLTVTTLEEVERLDLTIDGADEFDKELNLIKGGGGALLREKIVATASKRMLVIADRSKESPCLGSFPLPVEVIPFGWKSSRALIADVLARMDVDGREIRLRMDGTQPFRTDEGNLILDLQLKRIGDPAALAPALNRIPGVVENGLFIGICDRVVIGDPDGKAELRDLKAGTVEQESVDLTLDPAFFGGRG